MLILKALIVLTCLCIAFQDFKERAVYWFLFPLMGIFLTLSFYSNSEGAFYLWSIGSNLALTTIVIACLFAYTRLIQKKQFLNVSFGLGDLLFFYAFALGFPTYTFLVLFIGATFFSIIIFFLLRLRHKMSTVPLAGLMGLFLTAVVFFSALPYSPSLYLL